MQQVAAVVHQQHGGMRGGAGIVGFDRMDAEALAIAGEVAILPAAAP
jgi:hypothetical protein